MHKEFDYYTLRHGRWGGIDVLGWGTYPEHSVLAGQARKVWLDNFENVELAQQAYPQAQNFSNQYTEPQVSVNHLPDESTPRAGGMWPDDYED